MIERSAAQSPDGQVSAPACRAAKTHRSMPGGARASWLARLPSIRTPGRSGRWPDRPGYLGVPAATRWLHASAVMAKRSALQCSARSRPSLARRPNAPKPATAACAASTGRLRSALPRARRQARGAIQRRSRRISAQPSLWPVFPRWRSVGGTQWRAPAGAARRAERSWARGPGGKRLVGVVETRRSEGRCHGRPEEPGRPMSEGRARWRLCVEDTRNAPLTAQWTWLDLVAPKG